MYGCQYIGEFPAPRGGVRITDVSPSQGMQVYSEIIQKLNELGFMEKPIGKCVSFFENTHDCPKNFKVMEPGSPYVISLQIQISSSGTNVIYQYAEYYLHNIANRAPFTPYACAVLRDLNEYTVSIAPKRSITYLGAQRCDVPTI